MNRLGEIIRALWLPIGLVALTAELIATVALADGASGDTMSEAVRGRLRYGWPAPFVFALLHWLLWHWGYRPKNYGFGWVDIACLASGLIAGYLMRNI